MNNLTKLEKNPKPLIILCLLSALLVGCDITNGGRNRDATAMAIWAKDVRAKCEIVGHGIDLGDAGWWYKTDVLRCPDGSINVIPSGVPDKI